MVEVKSEIPNPKTAIMLKGLPPVMDSRITTLVLGSFPGAESLRQQQYYAHPQNQFWKLLGDVLDEPLKEMAYPERLTVLLKHQLGLWDVFAACERSGSLDSAIRNPEWNDFSMLKHAAPRLKRVCFNGKKSAAQSKALAGYAFTLHTLPSSSPAHATITYQAKQRAWEKTLNQL